MQGKQAPAEEKKEIPEQAPDVVPPDPAEQPADGAQPAGDAAPPETEDEEPFTLDDAPEATLPPRELNKRLDSAPEVKAALDKHPEIKNAIFEASRIATKAKDVLALIPDKETAQAVVQSADEFAELSGLFLDATDVNKTKSFLGRLQEYDTLRDESGQPLMENGRPKSSGAVGRFLDFTLDTAMEYWGAQAKTIKDKPDATDEELAQADSLTDAIETFQTARGRGTRSAAKEDLPENVKQQLADINSREETLRRQELDRAVATENTFETGVQTGIEGGLKSYIKTFLDQCDLEGLNADNIAKAIESNVYGTLKNSARFRGERDQLMRNPMNDKTKQDRVALAMRWAKPLAREAARKELKGAGARLKAKQAGVKDKSATGQQQSRSEPRGGGAPPAPAGSMSTEQLMDMARGEIRAAGGDPENTAVFMQKYLEVKQRLAVR